MNNIETQQDIKTLVTEIGRQAREASHKLMALGEEQKNRILLSMADAIDAKRKQIRSENLLDVEEGKENGLSDAMVDRLDLNEKRLESMIQGVRDIAALPDPVGRILKSWKKENGLQFNKTSVPIGVIGMIYESRPNVTADAGALCLKASNAIILRGGSEAIRSNRAIADAMIEGGQAAGLPVNALQLIPVRDREAVRQLITMDRYVDVIIPRGGEGLIRAVAENATVPVLKHYKGVCHVYVDNTADPEKALEIIVNAKCQRPGVCNAAESLLVHRDIAGTWLPKAVTVLRENGVELRGCKESRKLIPDMKKAVEEDWSTEYLELILSVKIVDNTEEAIEHINRYGSGHSDAIVSEDKRAQELFSRIVDSAAVYINASTRFTDGAEFGLGAEIGISTDRLHARGPVALQELTTYKYVVTGEGQIKV